MEPSRKLSVNSSALPIGSTVTVVVMAASSGCGTQLPMRSALLIVAVPLYADHLQLFAAVEASVLLDAGRFAI